MRSLRASTSSLVVDRKILHGQFRKGDSIMADLVTDHLGLAKK